MRAASSTSRFLAWAALCWAAGCAYSFSGSNLPGHIKTISVPVLANESFDYQVADEATQTLVDRFIQDNRLKIVPLSQADAVLEGSLASYENRVYSYDRNENPEQYIVIVKLSLTFKDRVKNNEIWKEEGLTGSQVYSPGGRVEGSPTTEEDARKLALAELATDVLTKTLEQW